MRITDHTRVHAAIYFFLWENVDTPDQASRKNNNNDSRYAYTSWTLINNDNVWSIGIRKSIDKIADSWYS